ncbi:aldehyde dehydrogenase family protein [Streptomyces sp900116325]|uniref:aldehyde dehydrogenase family protein n=1 Tax=Streptomyces sp. 900116325 TaxID=3154295 RepID=UPI0033A7DAA9
MSTSINDAEAMYSATTAAEKTVERLTAGEVNWARMPPAARRELLVRFAELVESNAAEWVQVAGEIKQLAPDSPLMGEEWISGPWAVLGYVHALCRTLELLESGGDVLNGIKMRTTEGGQLALEVLPVSIFDRLLLNGYSAEVWMRPEISENDLRATQGLGQRVPHETKGVALVLGAGNITSIAPLDVLYVLYADNRVAALKLNPITDRLRGVFETIFAPFIEIGAVEILTGGADLGAALAYHPGVAAVHMTGSEATHDAIVWGSGERGAANKKDGKPILQKPITSELGGVAPVIVVPGKWARSDLRFQAQHIATQRLHNSGSNCIAAQIVIVSSDWPQRDAFLDELRRALAAAPRRPAWYPGTDVRVRNARNMHPTANPVDGAGERTLITGLNAADPTETAFSEEYFGPVLGVAEIHGTGAEFLANAVDVANTRLRGTLGANVIAHPRTLKALGPAVEQNLERLRYGTVGLNVWTGVGYLTAYATWGAFPGHGLEDIQSGRGVVHNALLLDATERTVVRGPFRPSPRSLIHGEWSVSPKPPWFVSNRTAATTGRRLTSFAARPRWRALPGIFASALRG